MTDTPMAGSDLRTTLARLPKVELHRHLEGSLRLGTLCEIAREYALDVPTEPAQLRPLVQMMVYDEPSSANFLSKFMTLRKFYRSPEIIRRLAFEVIEDAARDNVSYLELRFTPMALAKSNGYSLRDVSHWMLMAVADARRAFPQLHVELIASINRHEAVEIAEEVTQIAVDHKEDIVGLDLAGDEANFSAEPFAPLFREARRAGLGITVHAGEWTGAENVRHAIERLEADRIGHGVRVVEDANVVALARERGTVFEVCVTSNWQSGVISRLSDHPLPAMLAHGLRVTLNTDDPAVEDVTLTDEYETAIIALGITPAQIKTTIRTAAQAAFLPPNEKQKLIQYLERLLV
ncbi:MAG: adenosine deaminase [Anaerolineales bacterium]|nr:adenosine deaminase [Anaerolineales bacterium]